MLAARWRETFRKKISWPSLSPFLLLGALSVGLGAALLAARSPALFLAAAWRVGWTSAGLTLLAFALAWWLQRRLCAKEQQAETNPAWLVRGHGLRFLAWFAGHNLFWTTFGCLSSALWLDLLGPRAWVLVYTAGALAGAAYALLGILFAHRVEILGVCWRSPVPQGVPLWAYPGATIVLHDRSEYAMTQDLGQPGSVLQQLTTILDLDRAGKAERAVNLWETPGLAAWQKELLPRFLVLSTFFIIVSGLALVTIAVLNAMLLPEWRPPLDEVTGHEAVPIGTVTGTPPSKTLTPEPITGTARREVLESQLTPEGIVENTSAASNGPGENRGTDGGAIPGTTATSNGPGENRAGDKGPLPGETSGNGPAKGGTGEGTPAAEGSTGSGIGESGTAKTELLPGEMAKSEPAEDQAPGSKPTAGEMAGNDAAGPDGAESTSGETAGNATVGKAGAELASGGVAENSVSGSETGQNPNPGETAGNGSGAAENSAEPGKGYGADKTFATVSPVPLPTAAQDRSDQPVTLEFVPVSGSGESRPETGTPLPGSPEPMMTGTLIPGATPMPAATLTPVQYLPNWILTLFK